MIRFKCLCGAVAICALFAAGPAAAFSNGQEYALCDGYGPPMRSGDGMTRGASAMSRLWSSARGSDELRREQPVYGVHGIQSCTEALAGSRLRPEYALRRASLLQGRALHRLAARQTREAMADLTAAEQAAAGSDVLAQRSFGLGLRLVRAFAQVQAGDTAAAAQTSAALIADRPFEPSITFAAARVHYAATQDWDAYTAHVRALARTDPNMITNLFVLALLRGEYREAIDLYPQTVLSVPQASGGYQIQGADALVAQHVVTGAFLDGAYAYALEMTGSSDAATRKLAEARRALDAAMAEPTPALGRSRPSREALARHTAILQRKADAEQALGEWERFVELRRLVRSGNVEAVAAELSRSPIPPGTPALELFQAMGEARPELREPLREPIQVLQERIAGELAKMMAFPVGDLASRLPEPESASRLPAYDSGSDGALSLDVNGFRAPRIVGENVQTVRFASGRGSLAVANEMALLRAAELARSSGRRGLILVGRRGVVRTAITQSYYGMVVDERPSGQEVELDFVAVDPASLPPAFAQAGWRVIDADAVWNSLSPIYARRSR